MWATATIVLTVTLGAAGFAFLRARKDATLYKSKYKEVAAALDTSRRFRAKEAISYKGRIDALQKEVLKLKSLIRDLDRMPEGR